MISMIIGGYMWNFIFTKVLYYMADHWGMTFLDKSWIGNPKYAFIAIIIVSSWGIVGYLMIIYMAGLQGVPAHLKESAALDGANAWQSFWRITFPMIRPALTICLFWTLNSTFQVFDVIYSLTGGGRLPLFNVVTVVLSFVVDVVTWLLPIILLKTFLSAISAITGFPFHRSVPDA